jgi:hypothetical protein
MKAKALFLRVFMLAVTGAISFSIRPSFGQTTNSLEQRLQKQEIRAIKEAVDAGRTDLIPLLEDLHRRSALQYDATRPWTQKALAKLGVKKYWEEIVEEFRNPTNTAAFAGHLSSSMYDNPESSIKAATGSTRGEAMKKMIYIQDPAAVKVVVPLLYGSMESPDDVRWVQAAVYFFSQMNLESGPGGKGSFQVGTLAQIQAWKNWWEQHKDYYEKLEFGQPLPPLPAVTTNTIARPVTAAPQPSNPAAAKPTTAPVAAPQENSHSVWLVAVLVALGALLGGAVLWRARRR